MSKENQKTEEGSFEKKDNVSCDSCIEHIKTKKNLIAILILFAGIAGGSFFIDIAQLFSQRGFSAKALQEVQVVEYDGNTWVRYDDPKVVVDVFDADDCAECVTDEVLVRLRSLIPTLEAHRIDVRSEEGKKYADASGIKHIPAFLFTDTVTESDFYQQAAILFRDNGDGKQYFEAPSVGVPIGEYLETPTSENGIALGLPEAQVEMVLYDAFTSDESRIAYPITEKIRAEYNGKVNLVVKPIADELNGNSMAAARAQYCAFTQENYEKYIDVMYRNHKNIRESAEVNTMLKNYAEKILLDMGQFTSCLEGEESQKYVDANMLEASKFGVIAAPTFFINGELHVGVITYESLKGKIDAVIGEVPQE